MNALRIAKYTTLILTGISLSACEAPTESQDLQFSSTSMSLSSDGEGGSICMQDSLGLIALDGSNIAFSGNAQVGGDAILFGSQAAKLSGNGSIAGTLYVANNSQVTMSGGASVGATSTQDLSSQIKTITDMNTSFSQMNSTLTIASVTKSTTITGNGNLNVISIPGDIALSGPKSLLLKGGESDTFVVNVGGSITLSGGASIKVIGVPTNRVLITNIGSGKSITLSGSSSVTGTLFAPSRGFSMSGGATVDGAVIASGSVKISGSGEIVHPNAFCSEAPIIDDPPPGDDGEGGGSTGGGDDGEGLPYCPNPVVCENF